MLSIDPQPAARIDNLFRQFFSDALVLANEASIGDVEATIANTHLECVMRGAAFLFLEECGLWHQFTYWAQGNYGLDLRSEKISDVFTAEHELF